MIYSLTVAPAIDYSLSMGDTPVKIDGVNRPRNDGFSLGGKGITVSMMLKNLKIESTPVIAVGGKVGKDIQDLVNQSFEKAIYLPTIGDSRIDVVITGAIHDLRFDPSAPKISNEGLTKMFNFFHDNLKKDDIVFSLVP
jgi:1-phosphofructokinase